MHLTEGLLSGNHTEYNVRVSWPLLLRHLTSGRNVFIHSIIFFTKDDNVLSTVQYTVVVMFPSYQG